MRLVDRMKVVKSLGKSNWLRSTKDEAIRRVMASSNSVNTLSRNVVGSMLDFIYDEYMKEAPVHRFWQETKEGDIFCSHCGKPSYDMHDEFVEFNGMRAIARVRPYYCSYCGARMDAEKEAENETDLGDL